MKKKLAQLFFICFLSHHVYCQNDNIQWIKQIGGTDNEVGYSIASDHQGNVYIYGSYRNTVDFDPGVNNFSLTSQGLYDLFIAKFNTNGDLIWAKSFGGTGNEFCTTMKLDSDGNIYLLGGFAESADFDPGVNSFILTSLFGHDAYTLKLDNNGTFLWVKHFEGTGGESNSAIEISEEGDVLICGTFSGTTNFNPEGVAYSVSTVGDSDSYVCKLDEDGNFIWVKTFGGIWIDWATDLELDSNGNIYITGWYSKTVDFDPGSGTHELSSVSNSLDVYVLKLSPLGNFIWVKGFGGTSTDDGMSLAFDNEQNLLITGRCIGTVDYDPGTDNHVISSNGSSDVYVLKLNSEGTFQWVKTFVGQEGDGAYSMVLNSDNEIFISGYFYGSADFNPGIGTYVLTSHGNIDAFVVKLTEAGDFIWAESYGGPFYDYANSLCLDDFGNLLLTGSFESSAVFTSVSETFTLNSLGSSEVFILKLGQFPLALPENISNFKIGVYPNPTNNSFFLDLPENEDYSLRMTDLQGKLVLEKQVYAMEKIEFAETQANGIYLVQLINENGQKTLFKVIKN